MSTRQVSDDWVAQTRGLRIDRDGYSPHLEQNPITVATITEENMVCPFTCFCPKLCVHLGASLSFCLLRCLATLPIVYGP